METSEAPPEPELSENNWRMLKQNFIPYFQAICDSKKKNNHKTAFFLVVVW